MLSIIHFLRTQRQERKEHEEYLRNLEVKAIVQEHMYELMSEMSKAGKL